MARDLLSLGDTTYRQAERTVTVKHPDTGEDLPITVSVVGTESDEFEQANHANRKIENARSLNGDGFDPAVQDEGIIRAAAFCTKGWSGIPTAWLKGDGSDAPLEFSRETAMALYKRLPWLRGQVLTGVWKGANFG